MTKDLLTATLDNNMLKVNINEEIARKKLETILSSALLPSEHKQVMEYAIKFTHGWFASGLAKHYKILANDILKIQREIVYDNEKFQVPMLFSVDLREELPREAELPPIKKGYSEYKIRAAVPSLDMMARKKFAQAQKISAGLVAKAYDDPLISRIMMEAGNRINLPYNADYNMIWAPDKLEINKTTPVPIDPAIIMGYGGLKFLVHKWDTPNERPIGPILQEFIVDFPKPYVERQLSLEEEARINAEGDRAVGEHLRKYG